MRKKVFGRKLKRDTNERKALFKGLLSSLVLNERIKTTEAKAKAIKAEADKLVSLAKRNQAERLSSGYLTQDAIRKLVANIAPGFKERNGGYTRILRVGNRFSDNASMVIMEWVERANVEKPAITGTQRSPRKTQKKQSVRSEKKSVSSVTARKKSKPARKASGSKRTTRGKPQRRTKK